MDDIGRVLIEFAVNLLLPWAAYTLLLPAIGEFWALALSALPPAVWSFAGLIRSRRLDALSVFVLAGIALSIAAIGLGGSPRMLLIRENAFSIPLGLAFLLTAPLRRPLLWHVVTAVLARRDDAAAFPPPDDTSLRRLRIVSAVWGAGLIAQGALLAWGAAFWPIARYLLMSRIIGYGSLLALGVWSYFFQTARVGRA